MFIESNMRRRKLDQVTQMGISVCYLMMRRTGAAKKRPKETKEQVGVANDRINVIVDHLLLGFGSCSCSSRA
jgi:hypothetical protein